MKSGRNYQKTLVYVDKTAIPAYKYNVYIITCDSFYVSKIQGRKGLKGYRKQEVIGAVIHLN